jgi:fibronectin type 3 domain-containing protein
MKVSRFIWLLVAIVAAGLALYMYRNAGGKPATHSVTLRWSVTPYATSYNVYRATANGGPYHKIGAAPTPAYVDAPVPSGAVFYYVVTAVSEGKESSFSKEMKAVVP